MVVARGETSALSDEVALPIPWSIVTWVAANTLHARVDVPPGAIFEGLALKDSMLGNCQSAPVVGG